MDGGRNGRIWQRKRCFGDIDGAQLLSLPFSLAVSLSLSVEVQGRKARVIHFCVCWSARSVLFTLPPLSETLTL